MVVAEAVAVAEVVVEEVVAEEVVVAEFPEVAGVLMFLRVQSRGGWTRTEHMPSIMLSVVGLS